MVDRFTSFFVRGYTPDCTIPPHYSASDGHTSFHGSICEPCADFIRDVGHRATKIVSDNLKRGFYTKRFVRDDELGLDQVSQSVFRSVGTNPLGCYVCYRIVHLKTAPDFKQWRDTEAHVQPNGDWLIWFKGGLRDFVRFDVIGVDEQKGKKGNLDGMVDRIPADVLSSDSARMIKYNWFDKCIHDHPECRQIRRYDQLPTRLIHVQGAGLGQNARLVASCDIETGFRYFTLSHSWGTEKFLTLTTSNKAQFEHALPLSDPNFNRTFKEALTMTVLLGYNYIWIDSLCIIQDSSSDWVNECPRMGLTYGNSDLNISATGFSNGRGGMLPYNRNVYLPPLMLSADGRRLRVVDTKVYGNWPLEGRGWVLQENILSPRTLHFTPTGLVWECCSLLATEVWPNELPDIEQQEPDNRVHFLQVRKRLYQKLPSAGSSQPAGKEPSELTWDQEKAISDWYNVILDQYQHMHLTYKTDKLPAVQGLANIMEKSLGTRYLAGHWQFGLMQSLTWRVLGLTPSKNVYSVAPSWSWASVNLDEPFWSSGYSQVFQISLAELLDATSPADDQSSPVHSRCRLKIRGAVHQLGAHHSDQILYFPDIKDDTPFRFKTSWLPDTLQRLVYDQESGVPTLLRLHPDNYRSPNFRTFLHNTGKRFDADDRFEMLTLHEGAGPLFCVLLAWDMARVEIKGLLLQQVYTEKDGPVCERIGLFSGKLERSNLDVSNVVQEMELSPVYLV